MKSFVHRILSIWAALLLAPLLALPASAVQNPAVPRDSRLQAGTAPTALHPISNVTSITAGEIHTCAVVSGGLKCWGDNTYGQLGDGTKNNQKLPMDVPGLTSGVSDVIAGAHHSCVLTTGGGVKCWGDNHGGQLGDGTTVYHYTPANVYGLTSGVQAFDAGRYHNCVLNSSNGVVCWGNNQDGEMGDGTYGTDRLVPVNVSGLSSGLKAVADGWYHSLALTTGGGIKCWGLSGDGQCGDGTGAPAVTNRLTPVDVSGLTSGVTNITGGAYHSCALTTAGGVKCWGRNSYGQLGDGTTTNRLLPVDVGGLYSGITAVAGGAYHTCALTSAGRVKCWGRNTNGQLGDGTKTNRPTPVEIPNLSGVMAITAGDYHTCAITSTHGMKCWGANGSGQLGDGTTTDQTDPVDVILPNHAPIISEGAAITVYVSEKRDEKSNNQEIYTVSQILNATDLDNDSLIWNISTPASHGIPSVSGLNTSATIRYTPNTGYSGGDSFDVRVSDGYDNGADTIHVSVVVQPPLHLPVALNQFFVPGYFENEPNNSCAEANGPLLQGQEYQGYPNDQKDFFYFDIGTTTNISVLLNHHTGNKVQLQLFYQNCDIANRIGWTTCDPKTPCSLHVASRQQGRYYIYIYTESGYNFTNKYSLTVNP